MSAQVNDSAGLKQLLKDLGVKSAEDVARLAKFEKIPLVDVGEGVEHNVTPVANSSGNFYLPEIYNAERDIGLRAETGSQKLKRLRPSHKKIIALHLAGWPNNAIAAHLGMHGNYVSIVIRDPLAQAVINDMAELHEQEFSRLRVLANDALREALGPEKPSSVRLKAASIFYKREGEMGAEKGETAEDVMAKVLAKIEGENVQVNITVNNHAKA